VLIILEVLRVLFIYIVGVLLLSNVEMWIYDLFSVKITEIFMIGLLCLANSIIIFVLYRNILQFSGWFNSAKGDRLNKGTTLFLMVTSIILLIIPILK